MSANVFVPNRRKHQIVFSFSRDSHLCLSISLQLVLDDAMKHKGEPTNTFSHSELESHFSEAVDSFFDFQVKKKIIWKRKERRQFFFIH